jgi:hypothetical protein
MLLAASETDERVLATLRVGAASLLLEDCAPAARVRAVGCSAVAVGFAPGDPVAGNPQARFRC